MASKVTPVGRVSFPNVFKPSAFEDQEPKYDLVLLFDKSDDLSVLKNAAQEAAKAKWGDKIPAGLRSPFRDGDEKPDLDGYEGKIFIRFSSKTKPCVVDGGRKPISEESNQLYAGCFARVSFTVFAYDIKGNRGIAFGLVNIQKVEDGEPFSGRTTPENDFDILDTLSHDLPEGADIFA